MLLSFWVQKGKTASGSGWLYIQKHFWVTFTAFSPQAGRDDTVGCRHQAMVCDSGQPANAAFTRNRESGWVMLGKRDRWNHQSCQVLGQTVREDAPAYSLRTQLPQHISARFSCVAGSTKTNGVVGKGFGPQMSSGAIFLYDHTRGGWNEGYSCGGINSGEGCCWAKP